MNYRALRCVNPLNRVDKNSRLPYRYDLNVYRGCGHGCEYCFARYSHDYLGDGDFFGSIYAKVNAAEALDRTLRTMRVKPKQINLGGVTDDYQPLEAELSLMPDVLRVLIRHRIPAIVSSKSDLVLRDMALLDELNRVAAVNVAETITTFTDAWKKLEPGASPPERRLAVLREAKRRGMVVGIHAMPVAPYLTDTDESLTRVYEAAREFDYLIVDPLNLRGATKDGFFAFLKRAYPELLPMYKLLYLSRSLDARYREKLEARLRAYYREYGVNPDYRAPLARRLNEIARRAPKQLSIFDAEETEFGAEETD